MGGAGTSTSAIGFGGLHSPPATPQAQTESWNGSVWTETSDLNVARFGMGGSGTSTAAISAGGGIPSTPAMAFTEEWNADFAYGVWVTGASMNTARSNLAGTGTRDAALAYGGPVADTELYNGTAWGEVNNLNTQRKQLAGNGTQTSSLAYGGENPGNSALNINESWNGTSWTEVADMNTTRRESGRAGADNTSALTFGGQVPGSPGHTVTAESWTEACWKEGNTENTAVQRMEGSGNITDA